MTDRPALKDVDPCFPFVAKDETSSESVHYVEDFVLTEMSSWSWANYIASRPKGTQTECGGILRLVEIKIAGADGVKDAFINNESSDLKVNELSDVTWWYGPR